MIDFATAQTVFYITGTVFMITATVVLIAIAIFTLMVRAKLKSVQKKMQKGLNAWLFFPKKSAKFWSGFWHGLNE